MTSCASSAKEPQFKELQKIGLFGQRKFGIAKGGEANAPKWVGSESATVQPKQGERNQSSGRVT